MKNKSFLSITICLLFFSCENSISTKDNDESFGGRMARADTKNIPDSIITMYFEDASYLTLRDIYITNLHKDSLIEIPSDLYKSITMVFFIYITHLICGERFSNSNLLNSLLALILTHIAFSSHSTDSKSWIKNWELGNRLTGNNDVDKLMKDYNLQIENYFVWPDVHTVEIYAPFSLNMFALANHFSKVDGVLYARLNEIEGDGNDIFGFITNQYVEFHYSLGFGDCPSALHCQA